MNGLTKVEMIVAGEEHGMFVLPGETFRDLRDRALRETEHHAPPYQPPDRWELRNHIGVEIRNLDQPAATLPDRGWPRLWLTLRAGAGS